MTCQEYFSKWLARQRLTVRTSTYESLCCYVNVHIVPFFYGKDLQDLTVQDIRTYIDEKLKSGRSDQKGALSLVTVRKHLSILKQALNEAVVLGYIGSNPCTSIKLARRKSVSAERMVFLSVDEAQAMLTAVKCSQYYTAVVLALFYGLRRSEVLGLKWSAIDFEKNTLTVRHTVVKNVSISREDVTKTETSFRTFELLPEIRDHLLSLPRLNEYICTSPSGEPLRPDSLTRGFQRCLAKSGLSKMRFHDLRHSTASILFDMGWQLEDVKDWLGHADIETTSNIYLHYSADRKRLLARDLIGKFKI